MDKKAIKTFAIESRQKLIEETKYQALRLGITADGIVDPVEKTDGMEVYDIGASNPHKIYDDEIKQRASLVKRIKEKDFDSVVEEVAYTWFNRIIAIRFMEVNDYLPTRVRVLSSETPNKSDPDIITQAPNIDLDFTEDEIQHVYQLKQDNQENELFKFLFIKQCNKLNEILPDLFEKTADYTELLLSISFTNPDGVVRQLVDEIGEDIFKDQVQIIGWLYQFYNTELKDETFALLKKRVKVTKERVPTITQLFTPDWIVRYMVENSLGRLWLEHYPDSDLKENWKYYLESHQAEDETLTPKINEKISVEEIKVIDPCMGSGHILVYIFDVLMDMYKSQGYNQQDAAELILKNNLYGLEIDDRAYQLSYFSVLMKARSYNKRILNNKPKLNLCSIQESNNIDDRLINFIAGSDQELEKDLHYIKSTFIDAKEYGSILNVKTLKFTKIYAKLDEIQNKHYSDIISLQYKQKLNEIYSLINQSNILSQKYDSVVTNPPYMASKGMSEKLSSYLTLNYNKLKRDLFAVFIEKSFSLCKNKGHVGLLTPYVWMFIASFSTLRETLTKNKWISTLTQLEYNAFPEACVPVCIFTFKNEIDDKNGEYIKLSDFKGIDVQEIKTLEAITNENCEYRFSTNQSNFINIPGIPIAYWVNQKIYNIFNESQTIKDFVDYTGSLHKTANNNKYLRFFWEIQFNDIGKKWRHYNKGGSFRKWYGNNDLVVNWTNDATTFYAEHPTANLFKKEFWDREGITWTALTSALFNARYFEKGFISDFKGSSIYPKDNLYNVLGYLNSIVFGTFIDLLAPTIDFNIGQVINVPFINQDNKEIDNIVKMNIIISKKNWDNYETSFDFKMHPFIEFKKNYNTLQNVFEEWKKFTHNNYSKLKFNEEQLNDIFIHLYGLEDELEKKVNDNNVSFIKADQNKDVRNFISYAVGSMFGRFSMNHEGFVYTGGKWDSSIYNEFIPDDDNIIPILDTEYFEDDIVGRFIEFIKVTFGEETLEENLDFIAKSLKKKGKTSREVIRNYFLTDFFKDHVQTYKKHPIYWLFDSGRNNGFKALIYMHRYEPDLVARVRTDYLHKTQTAMEAAIAHNDQIINNSNSASEKSKAVKAKNKLVKQLEETRKYDEALAHVANQKIEIDLDDGVKVNYAKFQAIQVSKEGKKSTKIDLLKKI